MDCQSQPPGLRFLGGLMALGLVFNHGAWVLCTTAQGQSGVEFARFSRCADSLPHQHENAAHDDHHHEHESHGERHDHNPIAHHDAHHHDCVDIALHQYARYSDERHEKSKAPALIATLPVDTELHAIQPTVHRDLLNPAPIPWKFQPPPTVILLI